MQKGKSTKKHEMEILKEVTSNLVLDWSALKRKKLHC